MEDLHSKFEINTGYVYQKLSSQWSKYPRELCIELEDRLDHIFTVSKLIEAPWDDKDLEYFETQLQIKVDRMDKRESNPDSYPFTEFFIRPYKNGYCSTTYIHSYFLTKDQHPDQFDFFFALELLFSDEMDIPDFLEFHLEFSFKNDFKVYKKFLTSLFVKYAFILNNGKIDQQYSNYMKENESSSNKNQKSDVIGARKILALHYIFEELLSEPRLHKPKIRLVQMLTGLGPDRVKQLMKNPLTNKSRLTDQQEDFKFVRQYFVDLKMDKIVIKIDQDLNSINNDKNIL